MTSVGGSIKAFHSTIFNLIIYTSCLIFFIFSDQLQPTYCLGLTRKETTERMKHHQNHSDGPMERKMIIWINLAQNGLVTPKQIKKKKNRIFYADTK